jgi:MFS family permease
VLRELKDLPGPVWILAGGTLVNRFGGFVLVFLTLYLTHQGMTVQQAGLVVGAYGGGKLAAAVAGGYLADVIGARRATALSMFASAGSVLMLWNVRGLLLTAVVAAATGLAAELYRPSTTLLMVETVPERQRVTAFGVYQLATNLGTAAGPAVAGLLATGSYGVLFVGDAVTSCMWGSLALLALPRDRPRDRRDRPRDRPGDRAGDRIVVPARAVIVRDRPFLRYLVATALLNLALFQTLSTFPLWARDHGVDVRSYGLLMALSGVLAVAGLPLSTFTRTLAPHRVMAAASVVVAVGLGLVGLGGSLILLACCVVVWSMGELVHWPVSAAYVARLAPSGLVGRYAGARSLVYGVAATLAPTLGTALYGVDPAAVWPVCALLALGGATLFAWPVARTRARPAVRRDRRRHVRPHRPGLTSGARTMGYPCSAAPHGAFPAAGKVHDPP